MHRLRPLLKAGQLPGLVPVSLCLLLLSSFLVSCQEGPSTEEEKSLRQVLREAKLPPLSGKGRERLQKEATKTPLPDKEEIAAAEVELPESARLPDFGGISDSRERKIRFFSYMEKLIEAENARVRKQRFRLLKLYHAFLRQDPLSAEEKKWLRELCGKYRQSFRDPPDLELFRDLLVKVDIVPKPLAVAQAANESAWGTSRFARMANNLFGQWCFREGCGLVPLRRSTGATHEVKRYFSPLLSVRDYINNLNSHPAYSEFREKRYRQRLSGSELDGSELAQGLVAYSGIGQEYISRLRIIMEQYLAYKEEKQAEKKAGQG